MSSLSSQTNRKNPLIVALDKMPRREAQQLAEKLQPTGCIFKLEDLIYREGIISILNAFSRFGDIMADMKLHGTPDTVASICRTFNDLDRPPWAVTIHGSGGNEMIAAARQELPVETRLLVITLLSTFNKKNSKEIYLRKPIDQVNKIAKISWQTGVSGFVCSANEVRALRKAYANAKLVAVGVRSPGAKHHDQKRVATPAQAMERGANHFVSGRQITEAANPLAEVKRIMSDELHIRTK